MAVREHGVLLCVLVVFGCLFATSIVVGADDGGSSGIVTVGEENVGYLNGTTTNPDNETDALPDNETDGEANNETDDPDNDTDSTPSNGSPITPGLGNETFEGTANETDEDPSLDGYDDLYIEFYLHENGTASWTVEYRYRLDKDDNETVDWEAFESDVTEESEAYLDLIERRWSDRAAEAGSEIGRNMSADNFTMATDNQTTPHEYGYVQFRFNWYKFAHVEVNRIKAGEAIEGLILDERTQLVVTWPDAYNATVSPPPDQQREAAVIWHGAETNFVDGEPRIELIESGEGPTTSEEEPEPDGTFPWLLGIILSMLAGGAIVGWWYRFRQPSSTADGNRPPERSGEGSPPLELLSNEERVLHLLESRGGRLKQQEVVSELGWTEAKTSQVVGQLRENDEIEVFRVGRENVLALPDEEDGG